MGVGAPKPQHHGSKNPMTESRLAGGDAKAPPALSDAEYQSMTPEQRRERLEVHRAYWSKRTRRQYLEHQGITQELIDVFTDRLKGIKSWSTDGGAFLTTRLQFGQRRSTTLSSLTVWWRCGLAS